MGLAAVVALGFAVIAPANKERDETNQVVVITKAARPLRELGSPAGAGHIIGGFIDTTAALWLSGSVMYVQPSAREDGGDGSRIPVLLPREPVPDVRGSGEYGSSSPDWRTLIEQWDDWDVSTMERIIACESGGNPNAISPGGYNVGAFQINVVHGYSVEQMTDPATSTALAHDIWLSQGYRAWSCY